MSGYRGFSVLVTIGRSGGFGIRRDGPALRLHFWWLAIDLIARDFQRQVAALVDAFDALAAAPTPHEGAPTQHDEVSE